MERRSIERLERSHYAVWRINKADTLAVRSETAAFDEARARLGPPTR